MFSQVRLGAGFLILPTEGGMAASESAGVDVALLAVLECDLIKGSIPEKQAIR